MDVDMHFNACPISQISCAISPIGQLQACTFSVFIQCDFTTLIIENSLLQSATG
jgi:hypothetical protein